MPTPVNAIQSIVEWSKKLPAWQSDALRRLFVNVDLSQEEKLEIVNMAKVANGIVVDPAPQTAIPFTELHAPGQSHSKDITYIRKIRDVKNINALASGQTVTLGGKGITVIYGDNGTGKSGYSRLLKRVCRARYTEEILPNILETSSGPTIPEAVFDIQVGESGKEKSLEWKEGAMPPKELSQITVFDTHCARVFIDDANTVNYIPYGLDVFPKLVNLFDTLSSVINEERTSLQMRDSVLQELVGEHEVGKLIASLSSKTKPGIVDNLAKVRNGEHEEYEKLDAAVKELQVNNPAKQAIVIRRTRQRILQLRDKIQNYFNLLNETTIQKLESAWQIAKTKSDAAKLASVQQFSGEPLAGVGNDTWREMYSHAREYSIQDAYPDKPFPVLDDGSHCLLCMQMLDSDAKDRMKRFENYIADKTEKEARDSKNTFIELFAPIKNIRIDDVDSTLIDVVREKNPGTADLLESINQNIVDIKDSIIAAVKTGDWHSASKPSLHILNELKQMIDSLEEEAKEKDKLVNPVEQNQIIKKHKELAARIKLNKHKEIVLDYIAKLKTADCLKNIVTSLNSRPVSIKAAQLTQQILTAELHNAINVELDCLNINHINLGLKPSSSKGDTKHQLVIADTKNTGKLTMILSDGEQRVIAIASFLAELSLAPVKGGIIFDDPVSSLGHKWAERIAERLIKEGLERQVIIFTHSLSFLLALYRNAAKHQVNISSQNLRRFEQKSGQCHDELPWSARNTAKRNEKLAELAQQARKVYKDDPDGEQYQTLHDQFYSRLRSTWERAVEELLLNNVVMRFDNGIATQLLNGVTVDDDDFITVFNAMSQSSSGISAHDHAADQHHQIYSPDDMDNEIKKMKDFETNVNKKRKETVLRRKASLKAPTH